MNGGTDTVVEGIEGTVKQTEEGTEAAGTVMTLHLSDTVRLFSLKRTAHFETVKVMLALPPPLPPRVMD